jgi:predicted outer membrane repeat protein
MRWLLFFFLFALTAASLPTLSGCKKHDRGGTGGVGADFVASPISGPAPLTVNFTDASTGTITSYEWDFDNDGTTDSTVQNPSYTYTNPGAYTVRLTVTGPGGFDDETKVDCITVHGAPVADFTATPTTGAEPLTVNFTDTSTSVISSWAWDFNNDGTTDSTIQNPSYTYDSPGSYTVKLTVLGPGGLDDETKVDYITVYGAPVADFTGSPLIGDTVTIFTFTDASTGDITSLSWIFGEGASPATADTQGPHSVTYSTIGQKTVSLTVTGPGGSDYVTKTDYIGVYAGITYVDWTNGDDANDGLSWETAVKTIQRGLDLAGNTGWAVLVANGTYTGTGNKELDFNGKAIHLESAGGAQNCIIDCGNSGGGFYFGSGEDANSVVEGFTINRGVADDGGAVYCWFSSPTITNCIFSNNSADYGGVVCCAYSSPTITNCIFSKNSAGYYGGAVFCAYYSSPIIADCTLSGNSAAEYGGAVCCGYSSISTITNSILWSNIATDSGNEIYVSSSSFVTLNNSDVTAGSYGGETGNITENTCIHLDPLFVGAAGGDYHLQGTSPCIDAGDNSLVPAGIATDLDGNPRIVDGNNDQTVTVDMGAYEYQP